MPATARNVIMNLLSDVRNYGFVPNGGRIYYLDRSQPPLLSEMIRSYVEYLQINGLSAEIAEFLEYAYPILQIEYNWYVCVYVCTCVYVCMSCMYVYMYDMPTPTSINLYYPLLQVDVPNQWSFHQSRWLHSERV